MTVLNSGISWCTGTLNAWVGCKPVSRACENCYAERLVNVVWPKQFGHPFDQVKTHLVRLDRDIPKFKPIVEDDGSRSPPLIFVNSLSDFFFEDVSDDDRHTAMDAFERHPDKIFQILTKRGGKARRFLVDRYGSAGAIPDHFWIGMTVEDNRVKKLLEILRDLKQQFPTMTAFASTEPITAPCDQLDYTDVDWVITGGESGPKAQVMVGAHLREAIEAAQKAGAALWHKQHGMKRSHPNFDKVPRDVKGIERGWTWLVDNLWELLPEEKGGATIDRCTYREMPPGYDLVRQRLNPQNDLFSA